MNIQLEPHALTPYFYFRVEVQDLTSVEAERPNYTEYNLFCLKSRLRPFINTRLSSRLTIQFTPTQRGDKIYLGVRLTDAGDRVNLTLVEQNALQGMVDMIVTANPYHCLLFSSDIPIKTDTRSRLPFTWVASMLRYLSIDPAVDPILERGNLLVNLGHNQDYDQDYNQLYDLITQHLQTWYREGVVICYRDFAEDWDLGLIHAFKDEEVGLYAPNWKDVRFAPDRVYFLTERMGHVPMIRLQIDPTLIDESMLSQELHDVDFIFQDDEIVVLEDLNLTTIRYLCNRIVALSQRPHSR